MAGGGLHHHVQLQEALLERLLVALTLEALQLDKLLLEVIFDPKGYLLAYIVDKAEFSTIARLELLALRQGISE